MNKLGVAEAANVVIFKAVREGLKLEVWSEVYLLEVPAGPIHHLLMDRFGVSSNVRLCACSGVAVRPVATKRLLLLMFPLTSISSQTNGAEHNLVLCELVQE
jgi:hypothetical protein